MTIAVTQFLLRLCITPHGCLAVQLCGFCLILANAVTGLIALSQFILGIRRALLCRFLVPSLSRHIIRQFLT